MCRMSSRKKGSRLSTGRSKLSDFGHHSFVMHRSKLWLSDFCQNCRFGGRLETIKENTKFRKESNQAESEAPSDLKSFVSEIKSTFGLK